MLTNQEAQQLLTEEFDRTSSNQDDEYGIFDDLTQEKPYGWIFFHGSKKYRETGDIRYAVVGNGPIVVEKEDGTITQLGTADPPEKFIEDYERRRPQLRAGQLIPDQNWTNFTATSTLRIETPFGVSFLFQFFGFMDRLASGSTRLRKGKGLVAEASTEHFLAVAERLDAKGKNDDIEAFGVASTVRVTFYMDPADLANSQEQIFTGVLALLKKRSWWNFVWLQDTPILLRTPAGVFLKEGESFWTPDRVQRLEVPVVSKPTLCRSEHS